MQGVENRTPIIVVHGGAGTIRGEERRQLAESGILKAINIGYSMLISGRTSVDAVEEAVRIMEDLPQFNAGYGSVVTDDKAIEMDAMIVDGATGDIGGVICVSRIKNPILLSRVIMNNSRHVLFMGKGAEQFAVKHGFELIDFNDLITPRVLQRYEEYQKSKSQDEKDPEGRGKFGTVGAIALDQFGNLAAATSTGGTLGKARGRVGDTPIFGAGTYADKNFAASSTGVGEYIIQGMLALRVKQKLENNFVNIKSLQIATKEALNEVNDRFGPSAIITLDNEGNWAAEHTTEDLVYAVKTHKFLKSFREDE